MHMPVRLLSHSLLLMTVFFSGASSVSFARMPDKAQEHPVRNAIRVAAICQNDRIHELVDIAESSNLFVLDLQDGSGGMRFDRPAGVKLSFTDNRVFVHPTGGSDSFQLGEVVVNPREMDCSGRQRVMRMASLVLDPSVRIQTQRRFSGICYSKPHPFPVVIPVLGLMRTLKYRVEAFANSTSILSLSSETTWTFDSAFECNASAFKGAF